MQIKILSEPLPNIPWQDKPENYTAPVWRYSENPIINRNPLPNVARIFNSAVMPYQNEFIGVFRGEQKNGVPMIYLGRSKDALHWEFEPEKIPFKDENGQDFMPLYAYDPRLVKVDDTYYIIWCQDMYGAAIGMAKTKDFKSFTRIENPFLPYNRNAVLFPRKINDKYIMLSRPCDNGHTAFGDIFLSESKDMEYWGHHRHVMGRTESWWESLKIGGGAAPIETDKGWLIFYHGVCNTCNGYVYSIGAAILDINEPSKVLHRCKDYVLTPEEWYEERGFVQNVCFPCATLHDSETGRIALYYGCADSYVGTAFTTAEEIYNYILEHDRVSPTDTEIGKR
ncbi:MAG: glycoside hydrolase family 130 protein [Ruminococcus sp.]|nr:glycoside hydrolase family 130 protein [Ruminococcus sp.]